MNKENPYNRILTAEQAELDALQSEEFETLSLTHPDLNEFPEVTQPANPEGIYYKTGKVSSRRAETVYMLMASGATRNQIAQDLGCTPQTITHYMNSPQARERIDYHRERLMGRGVKKRIESIAHKAMDRVEHTIDDDKIKPETRLSAATYVLDHSLGKPKQSIEHSGSILGEIMDRINGSRLVNELTTLPESPKDDLDNFAESFAPKHTVGVRNVKEGQ